MDGAANNLYVVSKKYQSSMAGRQTRLSGGTLSNVPVSALTAEPSFMCKRETDLRTTTTVWPQIMQHGKPPAVNCSHVFSTGGSAASVVRRFEGTTLEDRAGHGQLSWVELREELGDSHREAIRAEYAEMNSKPMRPA